MTYDHVKTIDPNKVPIIDITPLRDGSNPEDVAKQLFKASTGLGFIYIKGHGIPDKQIKSLRADGLEFFRSQNVLKAEISVSSRHRGWLGYGGAKMKDDAKPDLKESFIWGYEGNKKVIDDHPVRGPNQWPSFLPSLKENASSYFREADTLAKNLLKGFALGLGLEENFFIKNSSQPLSRASLVYYPDQPKTLGENQFGVSAHTDFGVLTVLCQDSVGGLQIQDLEGEWFHAPPIEGTIIVNVADLLSRWTDGLYKSTPHRVVNQSGKERMSIVLAFDPNPETIIDSKHIFGNDHVRKNDPISCGDYLVWRFAKAFSYRK
jgi:isopenicillin N synthase-like dioxygenase